MNNNRCAILTAFDPSKFRGGIETYTHQLVDLLEREGVRTDIYHTDRLPSGRAGKTPPSLPPRTRFDTLNRLKQRLLGNLPWPSSPGASRDAALPFDPRRSEFLTKLYPLGQGFYDIDDQYDFVISHAFFGYSYSAPRIPAYTILHSTHAQYAQDNREAFGERYYREIRTLLGLGAERLSTVGKKVIAVSDSVAKEARELYGATSVGTVWTGIDRQVFRPRKDRGELRRKYAIPPDAFVAVFVARWGRDKAVDVLQEVIAATPDVFWLLVLGTGEECPLAESGTLRILQKLDLAGVAEALALSDALFHPSRYEGFGLAAVEALACGVPVIAPPVGIMATLGKEPAFAPLMLPPYAQGKKEVVRGALDALALLRRDAPLRRASAQAGVETVEQRFDRRGWEAGMLAVLGLER